MVWLVSGWMDAPPDKQLAALDSVMCPCIPVQVELLLLLTINLAVPGIIILVTGFQCHTS